MRREDGLGGHARWRSQSQLHQFWLWDVLVSYHIHDSGELSNLLFTACCLWCELTLYTVSRKELGQTSSPVKTTFLTLNVDSACQRVKQGMKVCLVLSKSGHTLNVTEFVFIRAERQSSILGRVLDWESGKTVRVAVKIALLTSCADRDPPASVLRALLWRTDSYNSLKWDQVRWPNYIASLQELESVLHVPSSI